MARLHPSLDLGVFEFLRALGTGQAIARPDGDVSYFLVGFELLVSPADDFIGGGVTLKNQNRMDVISTYYHGFPHSRDPVEDIFHVLREDLQSLGRNDDFLRSASNDQVTRIIQSPNVPRVESSVFKCGSRFLGRLVITGGYTLSPDQNLSIGGDPYLDAFNRFADRAFHRIEGIVEGHYRRGLREPVSLDDGEFQTGPELFEFFGQRCGTDHKRPEPPSQKPVKAAVSPPAERPRRGWSRFAGLGELEKNMLLQHLENLGYRNKHGNTPVPNLPDEHRDRLPKHVTQWNQSQKAEWQ